MHRGKYAQYIPIYKTINIRGATYINYYCENLKIRKSILLADSVFENFDKVWDIMF